MIKNLYSPALLRAYHSPKHRGQIINPTFVTDVKNPSCGDAIQLMVRLENSRIIHMSFMGAGCILSQAAAEMLAEYAQSKTGFEILALDLASVQQLLGISVGVLREQCIMLALQALQEVIRSSE